MPSAPTTLLCECSHSQVLPAEAVAAARESRLEGSRNVQCIPDLCQLAAARSSLLSELASDESLEVVACHPRAVRWLFAAAGAPLSDSARITSLRSEGGTKGTPARVPPPGSWFPVVDFERCTQCMQCLNFCLFGVFSVDAHKRLEVQHPERCKPNCPACSRVCPERAIIFPKHPQASINGHMVTQSGTKVNVSALLGGDVYSTLKERTRNGPRFSAAKSTSDVLRQRQWLLNQMIEEGLIPPEVLQSLSAQEIASSTEAISAKGQSQKR